jgi:Fe-S-cluster-containing dehydrogenase component
MPTFGFLIDNRKCIGFHACTVACKSEHQVPLGVARRLSGDNPKHIIADLTRLP